MTEVKICGIRSSAELEMAKRADYVGFIVESDSPRRLEPSVAKELMSKARQRKVLVSTCRDPARLESLCKDLRPDVLQVHSYMSVIDINRLHSSLDLEVWALFPVEDPLDAMRLQVLEHIVDKVHLDSPSAQGGGMGITHDWELSRRVRSVIAPMGVVLAGGLTPDNVAKAVETVRPAIVDVSSGVEADGKKSLHLIDRFIDEAKRV